jgi:hypothetical protein
MAAPTTAANVKKALANSEPSTHGGQEFESLRARHKINDLAFSDFGLSGYGLTAGYYRTAEAVRRPIRA